MERLNLPALQNEVRTKDVVMSPNRVRMKERSIKCRRKCRQNVAKLPKVKVRSRAIRCRQEDLFIDYKGGTEDKTNRTKACRQGHRTSHSDGSRNLPPKVPPGPRSGQGQDGQYAAKIAAPGGGEKSSIVNLGGFRGHPSKVRVRSSPRKRPQRCAPKDAPRMPP